MTGDITLRDVNEGDLPIFFEQQLDPDANQMAAFTAPRDPADRDAFMAHCGSWKNAASRFPEKVKNIPTHVAGKRKSSY